MMNDVLNQEFAGVVTGECFTPKQLKEVFLREEAIKKAAQNQAFRDRKNLQGFMYCEYGSFFFTHYKEVLRLLVDEKRSFDSALAFRFVYLSTFMDYDNKLKWGNEFRGKYTGYMTVKNLPEVMKLSMNQVTKFKNRILELDLISIDEVGILSINKKYCKKGKLSASDKRNTIRCFEDGISELYENSTAKEHKRAGWFIQLLPYVNFNHSVLCWNPEEKEARNIKPLTIQDIADLLGQSIKNARRLEKDLYKITVDGSHVLGKFLYYSAEVFIINPAVYYKGNSLEELKGIRNLFDMISE